MGNHKKITRNTRNDGKTKSKMMELWQKWWDLYRISIHIWWGSPASINGGRWKLWEAVNKWGIYKRYMGFPQFFTAKSCECWSLIEVAISKLWKLWKNVMGVWLPSSLYRRFTGIDIGNDIGWFDFLEHQKWWTMIYFGNREDESESMWSWHLFTIRFLLDYPISCLNISKRKMMKKWRRNMK